MRTILACAVAAMLAFSGAGRAQAQSAPTGLVFGGVGGFSDHGQAVYQVGAGFQRLWEPGVGVVAEIGYVARFDGPGEGIGLLSANAIYAFRGSRARSRARPFVTGGYGMAFEEVTIHLANIGAGVDWSLGRVAWRIEVRDHFMLGDNGHFFQVRTGLVWQ